MTEGKAKEETADFMTLLRRARRVHDLIMIEHPTEGELNMTALLFCYMLFNSGNTPLGEILKQVGAVHDAIMLAKGTGELNKMLDELKKEDN